MSDEVRCRTNSDSKSLTSSAESSSRDKNGASSSGSCSGAENSGAGDDNNSARTVVNGVGAGMDFLNKYDASIASIKDRQKKMEKSSR